MHAYIYKSLNRADTYLYLAAREDFTPLPAALRQHLGRLQFVLDVELTATRKLAREDVASVRDNLAVRGFHLQVPPAGSDDPMTADWGTDA